MIDNADRRAARAGRRGRASCRRRLPGAARLLRRAIRCRDRAPAGCSTVLLYGLKRDLNAYLAATPGAPQPTIAEIVAFNSTYVPPMKYGQAIFEAAAQVDISPGSADTLRYLDDRA